MAILDEFKNAVEKGDVTLVRVMLNNCMREDKSLDSFNEELAYAEKRMNNLYDEHDGEVFDYDITKWDRDLLAVQMVNVTNNYSHERLDYIISLIKHIYAEERSRIETEKFIEQHSNMPAKAVGTGLVVGGVAAAVAGIVMASGEAGITAGSLALGGVGAACVVAGGIILYKNLK